jgi:hypothetical protein
MSIERKDVRAKLDPELHAALVEICNLDGIEIAEYIERLLVPAIRARCSGAIELSKRLQRAGFSGSGRE